MRRVAACLALLMTAGAAADELDRHSFTGAIDLSWSRADSQLPSWIEGGNGKLRFDEDHDGLRFSRAFLDYRGRLAPTVNARLTLYINDDASNKIDLTEAFMEWRPAPHSAWRLRSRLGAFYPRLSMENTDAGWSSPYALSSSVINTWIGEELRTVGAEVRATRSFPRFPEHQLSIEGAIFYGNDPTGALLTWRGWSAHDRQTGVNGAIPLAEVSAIEDWNIGPESDPPPHFKPFQEIDHKPGFYVGADWQWGERARLKVFHYDNRADPEAETTAGEYAWHTWFDHVGVQVLLPWDIGLISQWIGGSTQMGEDLGPWRVQDLDFDSTFLLLSRAFGRHRVSARYEWFDLQPFNDPDGFTNKDEGNALALSYLFEATKQIRIGAEYLSIASEHCDVDVFCAWVGIHGLPRTTREDSLQLTLRWQFTANP